MVKQLPTGTADAPWKRLPYGAGSPGMLNYPTGRDVTVAQQLIHDVYNAANQKTLELVTVGDVGVIQGNAAGRGSYVYDYSGKRRDWKTLAAATDPVYALDATIGKYILQANVAGRCLVNGWTPPAPSVLNAYCKSVIRFDSWPPGTKMGTTAQVNRYGWRTRSTPQTVESINSATGSGLADLPLNRWGILSWRFGNSTSDFIRFGAALNIKTGVNTGNTTPSIGTGLGKFASNSGASGIISSEACEFRWSTPLTPAEDQAVENLLYAYYNSAVLKYDSVGNIKPLLYSFFGDSITRGDLTYGYQNFRYVFFQNFFTTLGYSTYATGISSSGAWAQPENSGVSGLGINVSSGTISTPGAALAILNANYGAGASTPVNGNARVQLFHLMIGTNDVGGGFYVPVTTANDYKTLAQRVLDIEPMAVLVVTTIIPQLGDPPQVAQFNLELSTGGGIWDQLVSANPTRTIIRYDANAAISAGTGLYIAGNYIDALHPTMAGSALIGAALDAAIAATMNTNTQY